MKRRSFLLIGAGGLFGAAAISLRLASKSFEESGAAIIKRELPGLKLADEGIRRFMADYGKLKDDNFKRTIQLYRVLGVNAQRSGKVHELVTQYLLSTDFFVRGMDERKVVRYVSYYNPYQRPCSHPFSHAYY